MAKPLKAIPIPRKLDSVFSSIGKEFGITFSKVREAINKSPPPLDKLKCFLADGYSHLKSQISHSKSIDDVLDVVHDHCTLINISCLEGIVKRFDIKEAETHIQAYKNVVQFFCEKTKASLCLNETFKENKSHSLLKCETATFVLDWDPTNYTLQDIRDVIAESVEENVKIHVIRVNQSISEVGLIVEENTKELRSQNKLQQTIAKNRELLHIAMKEGYVTAKWTKFSVSGAPGTGKSSFLKLLYNEDPPIHHDSTPAVKVCEPRKINITPAIKGENDSNWIKIEHQSLLEMIAQGINDGIRHLKSASLENKPTLIGLDKSLDQAHDESYQLSNSNHPEQIPSAVTKEKENTLNSVTSQKILGLLPGQGKSEQLYQSHWIYGVDTGGQAAFLDIAPALLRYSSVNIITHKLTENLNDKALFYFSIKGKKVCQPEDRQITNLQLIEASFRSLSSVDSPKLPHIHIKSVQKPHGLVLGTFFDKIVEEGQLFDDKNELLFSTLKKFGEVLLMHRNVGEEVIFPINTMARGNRELKMAKKLRDKICQFFIEAEIPIRWFLFQLELDQHQKSYQSSIVSTMTCFKIGESLQMSPDDVAAALQYYHDLTIFLYFPKVLPKVVFLHPQLLFDKLSELISISFADAVDHLDDEGIFLPTGSYKELKEEGTFKEDLLTSPNSHLSHGFHPDFMPKDFLNLMTTLFIIAALPKEGKYFMPTVLPTTSFTEYKSVPPQFKQYTDPLILSWNMKPLPRGIFPALVVNLLHRNHSPKFQLTDPLCSIPRYRNAITLRTDYGDILLVDGIYWMAMYSTDPLKRCSTLREAAQTGISEVVDSFCYMANVKNFGEYFYCKICSNKTFEHFCHLNDDGKTITCCDNLTTACIYECCQLPWFSVEGNTISLDQLLDQQPLTLEITTYAKTAEWNKLGVQLQLNSVALAGCRDCTSMYQLWIMEKAGEATRKSLLDALKAIGQNDIARKYEEYLQTKVEKYESAHK